MCPSTKLSQVLKLTNFHSNVENKSIFPKNKICWAKLNIKEEVNWFSELINPSYPNISIEVLQTFLFTFPMELSRKI